MTNVNRAMIYKKKKKWRGFSEPLFIEKSSTTEFCIIAEGHHKVGRNHGDESIDSCQEELFNMEEKQHSSHEP